MTEDSSKSKKGFAGLSSMVSVVDVPEKPTVATPQADVEHSTAKRGSPLEFNIPPPPEIPFWSKSWVKWAGGALVALVLIGVFSEKKEAPSPVNTNYPSYSPSSTYSQSSKSPAYTPSSNFDTSTTTEEVPPVGTDLVLSESQLRYCLSQKIRLEGWETQVNSYSDHAVNSFNNAVQHYNNRCSSYRYRQRVLDSVNSQVEARRSSLYSEGLIKAAK